MRFSIFNHRIPLLAFCAAVLFQGETARAVLGEDEQSIAADAVSVSGVIHKPVDHGSYRIYTILHAERMMKIREFVSASTGLVFAVDIVDMSAPDISSFLGAYKDEYVQALAARQGRFQRIRSRHLTLQGPNLVVESSGKMRRFRATAMVPALFPQGLGPDVIH